MIVTTLGELRATVRSLLIEAADERGRDEEQVNYLDEDLSSIRGSIRFIERMLESLSKADELLRSVVGCLKSKPLERVLVRLERFAQANRDLLVELNDLQGIALGLDAALSERERTLVQAIVSGSQSAPGVDVPEGYDAFVARAKAFNRASSRLSNALHKLDVEEIGTAGSAMLNRYSSIIERVRFEYESEVGVQTTERDFMAELIVDRAREVAAEAVEGE